MMGAVPFAVKAMEAAQVPIVDSHIHLFDRNKPGGTFFPQKDDPVPGVSALPSRYRGVISPHGIVGAVVVEASPWVEENQWILDQAAKDTVILGYVGFIDPGLPDFGRNLERFHKNKLFRGIRYSNRNNQEGGAINDAIENPGFVSNLKLLADAGLSLDLGIAPDPSALLRVTDKVPSLRLVIPHLPNARMPEERAALEAYMGRLAELAKRPHVYMKLTEIIKRVSGATQNDPSLYKDRLDRLWDMFGEDRVMFGSDWPNSEHVATFGEVMSLGTAYIATKGSAVAEKVYWRNSAAAYRWTRREPGQPSA